MRDHRDTGKTRIYISHHHSPYENDFTARLEADLSAARADVRTDDDSVTRDAFVQVMLESRATRQFFLVVITPDSVGSPFVQREVSVALRERAAGRMIAVILVILLPTPPYEIPDPWRQLISIDATQGYESAHQEVLSALGLTGPVLSDRMGASNPTGWRQSTPGARPSEFPAQQPPVAGERSSRAAAGEPDTGPLPPFTQADEPDTGPLWPLPGAGSPAPEARETEREPAPGGEMARGADEARAERGGDTKPTEPPVGGASSAESGAAGTAGLTDAPSGGLYDGSLWDIQLTPADAPAPQADAPATPDQASTLDDERAAQSRDAPAAKPAPIEPEAPEVALSDPLATGETTMGAAPIPPAPPAPPDAPAPSDAMPAQQPAQPPSPPVAEPVPWPPPPPATSSIPAETAAPTAPDAPPDPFSNGPYHSPLETPADAQQWPAEKAASPGAGWDASGMRPPAPPRPDAGSSSDRRAQAATALERVAFTAYHPKEIQRGRSAPLLVYLALDDAAALAQVAAQAAERLAGRLDQYRAGIADQRLTLRRGAKLRIIPTIPGFHVNPQWMDVTWDEDAQQHEFSIRADSAPSGHAAEGAVRIYQGLTLRAEVPLSIFVSDGAGARLTPDAFASAIARAYRRVFASYSHRDTPVVESCEAAAEAIGDRYLRDVMTLQSGQLWNSQLMKMISEADVFQLFWSKNASSSGYVRQEWEYALTLQANRPGFIRPVYWSTAPFAIPPQLNPLHFEPLDLSALGWGPVRRFFYLMQS